MTTEAEAAAAKAAQEEADRKAAEEAAAGGTGKTEAELKAEEEARKAEEEAARLAAETPEQRAAREAEEAGNKERRRFSEVTRQRDEAMRKAAESERVAALALEALQRAGGAPGAEKPKAEEDKKPERPKFEDIQDPNKFAEAMTTYAEDLAAWTARKTVEAQMANIEKRRQEGTQRERIESVEREYVGHRQKALAELPDFETVAENPDLPVTPVMATAMKSTGEWAPKILYHLGLNPAEAARIAALPPGAQFMAIGAIQAKLEATPPKKEKNLPPPVKPVGAARSTTKTIEEVGNSDDPGSMEEYAAKRQEQLRASRPGAR